jgi:hypothetical protein
VHDVLHPHLVAAADALIIYEGCDGYYRQMIVLRGETPLEDCVGMFLFPLLVELEDLLGRLEAVHDRHVQVHKNQLVLGELHLRKIVINTEVRAANHEPALIAIFLRLLQACLV